MAKLIHWLNMYKYMSKVVFGKSEVEFKTDDLDTAINIGYALRLPLPINEVIQKLTWDHLVRLYLHYSIYRGGELGLVDIDIDLIMLGLLKSCPEHNWRKWDTSDVTGEIMRPLVKDYWETLLRAAYFKYEIKKLRDDLVDFDNYQVSNLEIKEVMCALNRSGV